MKIKLYRSDFRETAFEDILQSLKIPDATRESIDSIKLKIESSCVLDHSEKPIWYGYH